MKLTLEQKNKVKKFIKSLKEGNNPKSLVKRLIKALKDIADDMPGGFFEDEEKKFIKDHVKLFNKLSDTDKIKMLSLIEEQALIQKKFKGRPIPDSNPIFKKLNSFYDGK